MTAVAFGLADAHRQVEEFEDALAVLAGPHGVPGSGEPDLPIGRFFDLYFRIGRAVLEHPLLPAEIVGDCQPHSTSAPRWTAAISSTMCATTSR